MEHCEHRHLADVYDKTDIVKDKDGNVSVKQGAKINHKECQDCGKEVKI